MVVKILRVPVHLCLISHTHPYSKSKIPSEVTFSANENKLKINIKTPNVTARIKKE